MVIGIDEVGRGCWAGPLVAAAVGFTDKNVPRGLKDSKLLTHWQRVMFSDKIKLMTPLIGIGWVWPGEINTLGLTESVRKAMIRALKQIVYSQATIIVDGNVNYLQGYICEDETCDKALPCITCAQVKTLVKADQTVKEVSAASVVAKVARDSYMQQLSHQYPEYGFEKHVGYGTKQHHEALRLHGVIQEVHRLNYKPIQNLSTF